jgi:aldose 1-epimerase
VAKAQSVVEGSFGTLPDGSPVRVFALTGAGGMKLRVLDYGAIIVSLEVPDRNGRLGDVVNGHDDIEGYLTKSRFFGAVVGRYGNRIANGQFTLDGTTYHLTQNNGTNHLHGGAKGFDKRVWNVAILDDSRGPSIAFSLHSPAGDEGYPGNVDARVTYRVTAENALVIDYFATTDAPTIMNMTQHSYFNLGGDGSGDILGHRLALNAGHYTPVAGPMIPTGEIAPVDGTPFDFRRETTIGARIDDAHPQIQMAGGYDHNFALTRNGDGLSLAARLVEPVAGRTMEVSTTEPGMQFYTANKLDDSFVGKSGHVYRARTGFCLETQHYPDSPNHANFPSPVVRPGTPYRSTTVYAFGVA